MSMKRTAALSALWSAGETWGIRGISVVVFLVLVRLLDASAFGLMALAQVYLMVLQLLTDQGFAEAIIQRRELAPEHKDSAFWANVAIGVALGLAGALFAPAIAALYNDPRLVGVLRWLAITPVLASLTVVQQALLRRELRFKSLTIRQAFGSVAGGLVGIVMAFSGLGVWSLVGQHLVGQAVGLLVLWSISSWRPRLRFSWRHFRELFSFGTRVLGTGLLRIIGFQADRLLVGYFLGTTPLGYYSVAQHVLLIVTDVLSGSIERIVLPLFAMVQGEAERVRRGLFTMQRLLAFAAIPAFFGTAAVAPELTVVAFGAQWRPAVPPLQILSLVSLIFVLSFFFGHVLTALGRPGWRLVLVALYAVVNIAASLVGVRFGLAGVAIGLAVTHLAMYFVELEATRRLVAFPVPEYLALARAPLAAAIVMAAVIWGARLLLLPVLPPAAVLGISVLLGGAVYGLLTWLLAPGLYHEILDIGRSLARRPAASSE